MKRGKYHLSDAQYHRPLSYEILTGSCRIADFRKRQRFAVAGNLKNDDSVGRVVPERRPVMIANIAEEKNQYPELVRALVSGELVEPLHGIS